MELEKLLSSDEFKKSLRDAIESGVCEDWGFDGNDEYMYITFDADIAEKNVMELLTNKLLK